MDLSLDFLKNHLLFSFINNLINYVPYFFLIKIIFYFLLKYELYFDDFDNVEKLKNSIIYSNVTDFRGNPHGFMFGKYNIKNTYYYFLGYSYNNINMHGRSDLKSYLLMNNVLKNYLIPKSQIKSFEKEIGDINGYYINYCNLWRIRTQRIEIFPPKLKNKHVKKEKQSEIVTTIIKNLHIEENISVLVSGKAGTGKSSIGIILCDKLSKEGFNVNLLINFNPFIENNHIGTYINDFNPSYSKKNILILIVNEIDVYLNQMLKSEFNRELRPLIKNKSDWNDFFDAFSSQFYGNGIIILMTSNKNINYMNDIDDSYFRDHRINIKCDLD